MTDHVTVVKCGGGLTLDREAVCRDLAELSAAGRSVVLVHGGAADADRLAERLGVPQRRLTTPSGSSSRYTDPATLEVLLMALVGKIKPGLVAALSRYGTRAAGLTGMDGNLLRAKRTATHRAVLEGRRVVVRDDHNGRISTVDPAIVLTLLGQGIVPVVSPPALGEDGEPVNVDADRAAAAIAAGLSTVVPTDLVLLTAAPGVLKDYTDESTLLPDLLLSPEGAVSEEATGGMTVKLQAARDALLGGVGTVVIADGRGGSPVSSALAGAGTRVRVAELAGSH